MTAHSRIEVLERRMLYLRALLESGNHSDGAESYLRAELGALAEALPVLREAWADRLAQVD